MITSRHTHDRVALHISMIHGSHFNVSYHTYVHMHICVYHIFWTFYNGFTSFVLFCFVLYLLLHLTYQCTLSHICTYAYILYHTYVHMHICVYHSFLTFYNGFTSFVVFGKTPNFWYLLMSHISMYCITQKSHITHMTESCHTCEKVTSHTQG